LGAGKLDTEGRGPCCSGKSQLQTAAKTSGLSSAQASGELAQVERFNSTKSALSHALTETIWAVQPQPQLAPGSLPAKTLSHLTEDLEHGDSVGPRAAPETTGNEHANWHHLMSHTIAS
ncbi:hypothetical protein KUCAC02_001911, partial [Chaenocephalus aceratus]